MSCVLFNEYQTQDGNRIAEVVLNSERSLNALTLEMIDLIQPKLDQWKADDKVVAVILDSTGEKAFCAGGDVVNLYKSMTGEGDPDFPEAFFTREYVLDHCIHTYPKPVVCWGSGIVMGGGMGLMNGCSHRIVTETSHLAMPEVTIGLYPDVGGSWFLNHMPGNTGLFLGLTGNPMNAADALYLGLADRFIAKEMRQTMLEQMQAEHWGDNYAAVNRVLRSLETESQSLLNTLESQVSKHKDLIRRVTDQDSLQDLYDALMAEDSSDKWVSKAQRALSHGSPLAVHIIATQLEKTRHMSLTEMFESELVLSVQCGKHREFPEGVRALLVDKDGNPDWTYKSIGDVDQQVLASFFESPWQVNPLQGKL